MSPETLDDYAPIGRRSVPRSTAELPASGQHWVGQTRFVIKTERPGVFRWVMKSADGRDLELAQSGSIFSSEEACREQIRRLDSNAPIVKE